MSNVDKKNWVKLISYMATFDGGLYHRQGASNATFIMNMRKENLDYVQWVCDTLNQVVGAKISDRKDYNTDGCNRKPQVRLWSKQHPKLTTIRNRLYIHGHKVIDPHMLKLMDAEALAIIFMADGGTSLDLRFKNPCGQITINTKGFSYNDNMALSKTLHKKFGICTRVNRHNQYFYLNVRTKTHQLFIDTVKPHVLPSFSYKLERLAPVYNIG